MEASPSLAWLDLSNNPLGGEIPGFFGSMSALQVLKVNGCQLSGMIPSELANLSDLEFINNDIVGTIPASLGNLSKLRVLGLSRNRLTGEIPSALGNLGALEGLWLDENALTGEIPASMASLTSLEPGSLALTYNALWTQDSGLGAFLDSRQNGGDWRSTQTVPPAGVAATATSTTSVAVSWTPITYTDDAGGYRVSYASTSGGGQGAASQQVISLIANVDGLLGSHWMSDVKITNPYDQAMTVVLQGTPHDNSAGVSDPTLTRTVQPGGTLEIEDVYGALFGGQAEGKARLLITATDSQGAGIGAPIVTSNIYNAAANGGEFQTYGPPVRTDRLYQAGTTLGDNTVKGPGERYNFDVAAGIAGATILYTYRDSSGGDERIAIVTYKPVATRQHVSAQKLFGLSALAPNSSIVASIQAGAAFIRGTPANNGHERRPLPAVAACGRHCAVKEHHPQASGEENKSTRSVTQPISYSET